jgi:hypothetical protein
VSNANLDDDDVTTRLGVENGGKPQLALALVAAEEWNIATPPRVRRGGSTHAQRRVRDTSVSLLRDPKKST